MVTSSSHFLIAPTFGVQSQTGPKLDAMISWVGLAFIRRDSRKSPSLDIGAIYQVSFHAHVILNFKLFSRTFPWVEALQSTPSRPLRLAVLYVPSDSSWGPYKL